MHFRTTRRAFAAAFLLFAATSLTACDDPIGSEEEITLGGIFSLTGNWSTLGVTSEAAMELAIQDVNAYVGGDGPRFRAQIEDTRLEPAEALERVEALHDAGVRVVIGPQSSAEV